MDAAFDTDGRTARWGGYGWIIFVVGVLLGAAVVVAGMEFIPNLPTAAPPAPAPEKQQQSQQDRLYAAAKASISTSLFDPYSAVYDDLRVITTPGAELVCGTVNAKNRMGGYVGRKPFFYKPISDWSCVAGNYQGNFVCGDLLRLCFPQIRTPRNASESASWDRFGPPPE